MIKVNISITCDGKEYYVGDKVRILFQNWSGGVIGKIVEIHKDCIVLKLNGQDYQHTSITRIWKMRLAAENETFITVPYFNEEEQEFWRTHWITKKGIKEKTPEEIQMLEKKLEEWKCLK